ncbi:DUF3243 domain-containing protein [Paenibacillus jilunlii]|uniref:DUF3243 domain-containing protein n=1 Tax=Paenibacillus jilunlii TaxID=682956 RepID=A0A1G9N3V8_9BACL|nr:DUF3243 domain-containing protein [Paenibacillus jilunlii]KWX75647.1 hypothetical protein AML91_12565 [Paenibacillus jilunlii]SDL80787.1 Protein of unknown function [Paenibacillus jilunlii]
MSTDSVVKNFDTWKSFLGERVIQAEKMGMSDETISKLAFEIGEFLDKKVDPGNYSNRAIKELWDVGTDDEKQTIASLMVKLAKKNA